MSCIHFGHNFFQSPTCYPKASLPFFLWKANMFLLSMEFWVLNTPESYFPCSTDRFTCSEQGLDMHMCWPSCWGFPVSLNYAENKVLAVQLVVKGHVSPFFNKGLGILQVLAFFCVQITHCFAWQLWCLRTNWGFPPPTKTSHKEFLIQKQIPH